MARPVSDDLTGGAPGAAAELRTWLQRTLGDLAPSFAGPIDDGTALADGGLCLGSIELMELASAIEERLGIAVSETDITPENFGTVSRLLAFLQSPATRP